MNIDLIIFVSSITRIFLALQNSYIHPDEQLQSFEVINALFEPSDLPWEFTSAAPARSLAPLFVLYYPFMKLLRGFLDPIAVLYTVRLFFCAVSWIIVDTLFISQFCENSRKRSQSKLLSSTSYIIWVFQCHTFSNSVETWLLLGCVILLDKINHYERSLRNSALLGFLVAAGCFNRITFPGFLVLPGLYVLRRLKFVDFCAIGLSFAVTSALFVWGDTNLYVGIISKVTGKSYKTPVIAPLNNLFYNSNYENLEIHGIHPRFTHITANLGQMLGPLYLIFIVNIRDYFAYLISSVRQEKHGKSKPQTEESERQRAKFHNYRSDNILYLTILSGLFFLSLFPHQELRFLVPLQPVILQILDFEFLQEKIQTGKTTWHVITNRSKLVLRNVLWVWFAFNGAMGIFMGILHQGGVLTMSDHLKNRNDVQVWWRTYPPPHWLQGNQSSIYDLMGAEANDVNKVLQKERKGVLVCPIGSYSSLNLTGIETQYLWGSKLHMDMDHGSFMPGIGAWNWSVKL